MSYPVIVVPAAAEHLAQALRDREDQATRQALLAEIAAVLDKIGERPRRFPVAYGQVHRALTPRWHFAIFFEVIDERAEVVVVGILHQRRDPALWPRR